MLPESSGRIISKFQMVLTHPMFICLREENVYIVRDSTHL